MQVVQRAGWRCILSCSQLLVRQTEAACPLTGLVTQPLQLQAHGAHTESQAHFKQRVAYQDALHRLRSQWTKEFKEKDEQKRKRLEARTERIQAQKQKRLERKRRRQVGRAAVLAEQAKEEGVLRAARQEKAMRWREAVAGIYSKLQKRREEQLLSESRNWIRQEDLDARIEEALDNPVPMYVTKF